MTFYCYSYILLTNNNHYQSLWQAFQCVLKDWLVWIAVSPLLLSAAKQNVSCRNGQVSALSLLLVCVSLAGVYRIVIELWVSGYSAITTFYIYFPRYIIASVLTLVTCSYYIYKVNAEQKLKQYQIEISQFKNIVVKPKQTFLVDKGTAKVVIEEDDIVCVIANGNYLEIQTSCENYLFRKTMKEMEALLTPDKFIRIHRSHMVRLSEIHSICRTKLEARLYNHKILRVGKKYLLALPHFKG
ncbi:LytTR family transcriptional regulator [Paraglaciecola aquimarina]|uniref:LytTR family transcriptional regulator n=1 Tax=Paraglaciecola algarum TaxID=3050085 RepID=A0ABS9D308_9ALTE|nr:LytTR family DNA-binding domain-containing protein [Paraglaciecola sp. G1-23]MCF2946815.1 LytTR family transcriptional regulator [Paraglaciecola sp. G1-23]